MVSSVLPHSVFNISANKMAGRARTLAFLLLLLFGLGSCLTTPFAVATAAPNLVGSTGHPHQIQRTTQQIREEEAKAVELYLSCTPRGSEFTPSAQHVQTTLLVFPFLLSTGLLQYLAPARVTKIARIFFQAQVVVSGERYQFGSQIIDSCPIGLPRPVLQAYWREVFAWVDGSDPQSLSEKYELAMGSLTALLLHPRERAVAIQQYHALGFNPGNHFAQLLSSGMVRRLSEDQVRQAANAYFDQRSSLGDGFVAVANRFGHAKNLADSIPARDLADVETTKEHLVLRAFWQSVFAWLSRSLNEENNGGAALSQHHLDSATHKALHEQRWIISRFAERNYLLPADRERACRGWFDFCESGRERESLARNPETARLLTRQQLTNITRETFDSCVYPLPGQEDSWGPAPCSRQRWKELVSEPERAQFLTVEQIRDGVSGALETIKPENRLKLVQNVSKEWGQAIEKRGAEISAEQRQAFWAAAFALFPSPHQWEAVATSGDIFSDVRKTYHPVPLQGAFLPLELKTPVVRRKIMNQSTPFDTQLMIASSPDLAPLLDPAWFEGFWAKAFLQIDPLAQMEACVPPHPASGVLNENAKRMAVDNFWVRSSVGLWTSVLSERKETFKKRWEVVSQHQLGPFLAADRRQRAFNVWFDNCGGESEQVKLATTQPEFWRRKFEGGSGSLEGDFGTLNAHGRYHYATREAFQEVLTNEQRQRAVSKYFEEHADLQERFHIATNKVAGEQFLTQEEKDAAFAAYFDSSPEAEQVALAADPRYEKLWTRYLSGGGSAAQAFRLAVHPLLSGLVSPANKRSAVQEYFDGLLSAPLPVGAPSGGNSADQERGRVMERFKVATHPPAATWLREDQLARAWTDWLEESGKVLRNCSVWPSVDENGFFAEWEALFSLQSHPETEWLAAHVGMMIPPVGGEEEDQAQATQVQAQQEMNPLRNAIQHYFQTATLKERFLVTTDPILALALTHNQIALTAQEWFNEFEQDALAQFEIATHPALYQFLWALPDGGGLFPVHNQVWAALQEQTKNAAHQKNTALLQRIAVVIADRARVPEAFTAMKTEVLEALMTALVEANSELEELWATGGFGAMMLGGSGSFSGGSDGPRPLSSTARARASGFASTSVPGSPQDERRGASPGSPDVCMEKKRLRREASGDVASTAASSTRVPSSASARSSSNSSDIFMSPRSSLSEESEVEERVPEESDSGAAHQQTHADQIPPSSHIEHYRRIHSQQSLVDTLTSVISQEMTLRQLKGEHEEFNPLPDVELLSKVLASDRSWKDVEAFDWLALYAGKTNFLMKVNFRNLVLEVFASFARVMFSDNSVSLLSKDYLTWLSDNVLLAKEPGGPLLLQGISALGIVAHKRTPFQETALPVAAQQHQHDTNPTIVAFPIWQHTEDVVKNPNGNLQILLDQLRRLSVANGGFGESFGDFEIEDVADLRALLNMELRRQEIDAGRLGGETQLRELETDGAVRGLGWLRAAAKIFTIKINIVSDGGEGGERLSSEKKVASVGEGPAITLLYSAMGEFPKDLLPDLKGDTDLIGDLCPSFHAVVYKVAPAAVDATTGVSQSSWEDAFLFDVLRTAVRTVYGYEMSSYGEEERMAPKPVASARLNSIYLAGRVSVTRLPSAVLEPYLERLVEVYRNPRDQLLEDKNAAEEKHAMEEEEEEDAAAQPPTPVELFQDAWSDLQDSLAVGCAKFSARIPFETTAVGSLGDLSPVACEHHAARELLEALLAWASEEELVGSGLARLSVDMQDLAGVARTNLVELFQDIVRAPTDKRTGLQMTAVVRRRAVFILRLYIAAQGPTGQKPVDQAAFNELASTILAERPAPAREMTARKSQKETFLTREQIDLFSTLLPFFERSSDGRDLRVLAEAVRVTKAHNIGEHSGARDTFMRSAQQQGAAALVTALDGVRWAAVMQNSDVAEWALHQWADKCGGQVVGTGLCPHVVKEFRQFVRKQPYWSVEGLRKLSTLLFGLERARVRGGQPGLDAAATQARHQAFLVIVFLRDFGAVMNEQTAMLVLDQKRGTSDRCSISSGDCLKLLYADWRRREKITTDRKQGLLSKTEIAKCIECAANKNEVVQSELLKKATEKLLAQRDEIMGTRDDLSGARDIIGLLDKPSHLCSVYGQTLCPGDIGGKNVKSYTAEDVKKFAREYQKHGRVANGSNRPPIKHLVVFVMQAHRIYTRKGKTDPDAGFYLRDTQLYTVLAMMEAYGGHHDGGGATTTGGRDFPAKGRLAQVPTGEGKTAIVAVLTGILALDGRLVDNITSSPVLAQREQRDHAPYYEVLLGITTSFVGEGADGGGRDSEKEAKLHKAVVVFSTAFNLAAAHLSDVFKSAPCRDGKCEGRGGRKFDFAVIDEVDSLLVDQRSGSCMLITPVPGALSNDVMVAVAWRQASMINDMIEDHRDETSGQQLHYLKNGSATPGEAIEHFRNADGTRMYTDVQDFMRQHVEIHMRKLLRDTSREPRKFSYLPDKRLSDKDIDEVNRGDESETIRKDRYFADLQKKMDAGVFASDRGDYLRAAEELRTRTTTNHEQPYPRMNVAKHLKDWMLQTAIAEWANGAVEAIRWMKQNQDYVTHNGQVKVLDNTTGMRNENMTMHGGKTAFLSMEHGVRLKGSGGCKTNWIAYSSLFQKYQGRVFGMTGTMGETSTKGLIASEFGVDMMEVPGFRASQNRELVGVATRGRNHTNSEILKRIELQVVGLKRAALILCRDPGQVLALEEAVHTLNAQLAASNMNPINIKTVLDQDNVEAVEGAEVNPGDVILATNIFGRGTDLSVSEALMDNGGLQVFLPQLTASRRTELQNVGRTARKGDPGSFQLFIDLYSADAYRFRGTFIAWNLSVRNADHAHGIRKLQKRRDEKERLSDLSAKQEIGETSEQDAVFVAFLGLRKWANIKWKEAKKGEEERTALRKGLDQRFGMWHGMAAAHPRGTTNEKCNKDLFEKDFAAKIRQEIEAGQDVCHNPWFYTSESRTLVVNKKWKPALGLLKKAFDRGEPLCYEGCVNAAVCHIGAYGCDPRKRGEWSCPPSVLANTKQVLAEDYNNFLTVLQLAAASAKRKTEGEQSPFEKQVQGLNQLREGSLQVVTDILGDPNTPRALRDAAKKHLDGIRTEIANAEAEVAQVKRLRNDCGGGEVAFPAKIAVLIPGEEEGNTAQKALRGEYALKQGNGRSWYEHVGGDGRTLQYSTGVWTLAQHATKIQCSQPSSQGGQTADRVSACKDASRLPHEGGGSAQWADGVEILPVTETLDYIRRLGLQPVPGAAIGTDASGQEKLWELQKERLLPPAQKNPVASGAQDLRKIRVEDLPQRRVCEVVLDQYAHATEAALKKLKQALTDNEIDLKAREDAVKRADNGSEDEKKQMRAVELGKWRDGVEQHDDKDVAWWDSRMDLEVVEIKPIFDQYHRNHTENMKFWLGDTYKQIHDEDFEAVWDNGVIGAVDFLIKKGIQWVAFVGMAMWGLAQVAAGAAIVILSMGAASNLGSAFIGEGVGDIFRAVQDCIIERNFSPLKYLKDKAISIAITVATAGMSALKEAAKIGCTIGKVGVRCGWQAAKIAAQHVGKAVGVQIAGIVVGKIAEVAVPAIAGDMIKDKFSKMIEDMVLSGLRSEADQPGSTLENMMRIDASRFGQEMAGLAASIVNKSAPKPSSLASNVSGELEEVLTKGGHEFAGFMTKLTMDVGTAFVKKGVSKSISKSAGGGWAIAAQCACEVATAGVDIALTENGIKNFAAPVQSQVSASCRVMSQNCCQDACYFSRREIDRAIDQIEGCDKTTKSEEQNGALVAQVKQKLAAKNAARRDKTEQEVLFDDNKIRERVHAKRELVRNVKGSLDNLKSTLVSACTRCYEAKMTQVTSQGMNMALMPLWMKWAMQGNWVIYVLRSSKFYWGLLGIKYNFKDTRSHDVQHSMSRMIRWDQKLDEGLQEWRDQNQLMYESGMNKSERDLFNTHHKWRAGKQAKEYRRQRAKMSPEEREAERKAGGLGGNKKRQAEYHQEQAVHNVEAGGELSAHDIGVLSKELGHPITICDEHGNDLCPMGRTEKGKPVRIRRVPVEGEPDKFHYMADGKGTMSTKNAKVQSGLNNCAIDAVLDQLPSDKVVGGNRQQKANNVRKKIAENFKKDTGFFGRQGENLARGCHWTGGMVWHYIDNSGKKQTATTSAQKEAVIAMLENHTDAEIARRLSFEAEPDEDIKNMADALGNESNKNSFENIGVWENHRKKDGTGSEKHPYNVMRATSDGGWALKTETDGAAQHHGIPRRAFKEATRAAKQDVENMGYKPTLKQRRAEHDGPRRDGLNRFIERDQGNVYGMAPSAKAPSQPGKVNSAGPQRQDKQNTVAMFRYAAKRRTEGGNSLTGGTDPVARGRKLDGEMLAQRMLWHPANVLPGGPAGGDIPALHPSDNRKFPVVASGSGASGFELFGKPKKPDSAAPPHHNIETTGHLTDRVDPLVIDALWGRKDTLHKQNAGAHLNAYIDAQPGVATGVNKYAEGPQFQNGERHWLQHQLNFMAAATEAHDFTSRRVPNPECGHTTNGQTAYFADCQSVTCNNIGKPKAGDVYRNSPFPFAKDPVTGAPNITNPDCSNALNCLEKIHNNHPLIEPPPCGPYKPGDTDVAYEQWKQQRNYRNGILRKTYVVLGLPQDSYGLFTDASGFRQYGHPNWSGVDNVAFPTAPGAPKSGRAYPITPLTGYTGTMPNPPTNGESIRPRICHAGGLAPPPTIPAPL